MSSSATSITYERIEFKENPKRYLAFDDKDVLDYIIKVKTAKKSGYRIYTMYHSYQLLTARKNDVKKIGKAVGRKGFNYFLFVFDLIFIDLLTQLILLNFKI